MSDHKGHPGGPSAMRQDDKEQEDKARNSDKGGEQGKKSNERTKGGTPGATGKKRGK
jgi:hypothetical protein